MRPEEIVELFELVPPGTPVDRGMNLSSRPLRICNWDEGRRLVMPLGRVRVFVEEQGVPADIGTR